MEAADGGGGGSDDDVDEFVAILQLMRLGYMRWLSLLMVDCCRYDITYLLGARMNVLSERGERDDDAAKYLSSCQILFTHNVVCN